MFRNIILFLIFITSSILSLDVYACYVDTTYSKSQCAGWGKTPVHAYCHTSDPQNLKTWCVSDTSPFPDAHLFCLHGLPNEYKCPEPSPEKAQNNTFPKCPKVSVGSIVQIDNQVLIEKVKLTGINYGLTYSSIKTKGRKDWFKVKIPISGSYSNGYVNVVSEELKIIIADKTHTVNFNPAVGLIYEFIWDGKDNNGNLVYGSYPAKIVVTEKYDFPTISASYYPVVRPIESVDKGIVSSSKSQKERANDISFVDAPVISDVFLGSIFEGVTNLGGWSFDIHHRYDPVRKTLYYGDGGTLDIKFIDKTPLEKWIVVREKSEIYVFDDEFKHVKTLNSNTGTTKLTFSYDTDKKLISITDKYLNATTIQYADATPVSVTSPNGQVTYFEINSLGYLSKIRNPANESYEMTYDDDGLMLSFTKPSGVISTFSYNVDGLLSADSSTGGSSISIQNTLNGKTETSALGRVESHFYTSGPDLYTRNVNKPDGFQYSYSERNKLGQATYSDTSRYTSSSSSGPDTRFGNNLLLQSSSSISNAAQTLSVNNSELFTLTDEANPFSFSSLTSQTIQNSKIFQSVYNPLEKKITTFTPMGKKTTLYLNSYDDVISSQFASETPVNLSYDTKGRIKQILNGPNRTTLLSYNSEGYLSSVRNALNQVTSFSYDLAGRISSYVLPDNREITFTYDFNGNLKSVTPPSGHTHEMEYNDFDFLGSYIPPYLAAPDTTTTNFIFDNDRNLVSVQRPDGSSIERNFNPTTGVLETEVFPTGIRNYIHYSGLLNTAVSEDSFTRKYSWWGTEMLNETVFGGSSNYFLNYLYNNFFLLTEESLSVGSQQSNISFNFDDDNMLIQAGDQSYTRSSVNGAIVKTNLHSVSQNFSYFTKFSELEGHTAKFNSTLLYQESFTRDNLGRIATRTEKFDCLPSDKYSYTYDLAGRLIRVKKNNAQYMEYSYDSNSNRVSQTIEGVTTSGIVYDEQDRLLNFGDKSFSYNANGELTSVLTSSPETVSNFVYDVFGNLKSVTLPSKAITYGVDASNRRMVKKIDGIVTNYFIWNKNNQLIGLSDANGTLTHRFVYGSKAHSPDYMIKGSTKFQIISNHLGSPVLVVNATTGNVAQKVVYDEFGRVLSDTAPGFTPFGFAGCLYDVDTKLCRFGARDYDPSVGRWLSKDPILFAAGDTNLYGYVFQDPINFIDPTGLVCQYSQSSGQMSCSNNGQIYYSASGYSGSNSNSGRNNFFQQGTPNTGPIPLGTYTVGTPYNSPNTGRNTMVLTPNMQTLTSILSTGRDPGSFRIHGNNSSNNASHGCIILPPNRTNIPPGETVNVGL